MTDDRQSKSDIHKKLMAAPPDQIDGVGNLVNVSGDGMDCLIRSLLVASGRGAYANGDPDNLVELLRNHLIAQRVAMHGSMLDLAGAAGAVLISEMVRRGIFNADRGLNLYRRNAVTGEIEPLPILGGNNALAIWLSGEHFRAIV